jgi:hypothetical protein
LLLAFAWQVSDSPTDGALAAYGLYLTWLAWLLAALGAAVLAFRGRVGPQPDPQLGPGSAPLR